MNLKERIETAILNGEILEIKYFGGSTPGRQRSIAPVKIEGNKLKARCLVTNIVKTFSLDKISFSDGGEVYEASKNAVEQLNRQSFENIEDLYINYKPIFEEKGWFVKLDNSESLSLHSYFKNGNPKKSSDVSIFYDEYSEQMIYDLEKDDFITEKTKKQKPWCVMAKGETTRNYANLHHCIETFIDFSEKLSPNNNS